MKRFLPLFLLLAACSNTGEEQEPPFPRSEVFKHPMGPSEVYGLRIFDYSAKPANRGYAVQLEKGNKVWTDTLYLQHSGTDTLISEVIFSDAKALKEDTVSHRIKYFDAQ